MTSEKKQWTRPEVVRLGEMRDVAQFKTRIIQGSGTNNQLNS